MRTYVWDGLVVEFVHILVDYECILEVILQLFAECDSVALSAYGEQVINRSSVPLILLCRLHEEISCQAFEECLLLSTL